MSRKRYDDGGIVASEILQQLGGTGRLRAMTGAYNFIDIGNGVSFKLKNPRANYVKIKLNSLDLYDLEVGRIRGDSYKIVAEHNNIYADQLKPLIEKATGLYLSFKNGGVTESRIKSKLDKSSFSLPYQIAIYVPSTKDKDVVVSKRELDNRVDEVKKYLAQLFGGFNSVKVEGGYQSQDKGLIKEDAVRVVAFGNKENIDENFKQLISKIKYWCTKWGQESMGLEFENDMFYIDQSSKFSDGGMMASGGKVDTQYVNVYVMENCQLRKLENSYGMGKMTREEAENWYKTRESINKLGKSNVYIGNLEYSRQRKEDGGMMADGGMTEEIYQIKDVDSDKYFSAGKWYSSPDMGYQYSMGEAENIKDNLLKIGYNVQIVKYNKDWWKYAKGGYIDLSKEKPSIMQDSEKFKVPEIDLIKIDTRKFEGSSTIRGSEDAVEIFRQFWNKNSLPISENLNVMLLNQANKVIGIYQHSKGSVNGTVADPEMIALVAVKSLAKGVILAHNHPSGNLKPSTSDVNIANKIKQGLKLFDINLLDSLIITEDSFNSMADSGDIMANGGKVRDYDEVDRKIVLKAIKEDKFKYEEVQNGIRAYSDVYYDGDIYTAMLEAKGKLINNIEIDSMEIDIDIFSDDEKKVLNDFFKELREQYKKGGKVKWIQEALGNDNKGVLRKTAKRKGLLTGDENLSMTDLKKLEKMGGKTAKRAYLAETLRKF